ncbi:ATP-binding protein [Coleofasciculus sp.]|uniref:ATP-binding protein n=1 Tax=Coleofasciculus sp. TaxID=3100458 RepID=UPI003A34DD75
MMNSQILIINDPKLLRQMLSNLLTNARKYSPNGDPVDFELNREENQAILIICNSRSRYRHSRQGPSAFI